MISPIPTLETLIPAEYRGSDLYDTLLGGVVFQADLLVPQDPAVLDGQSLRVARDNGMDAVTSIHFRKGISSTTEELVDLDLDVSSVGSGDARAICIKGERSIFDSERNGGELLSRRLIHLGCDQKSWASLFVVTVGLHRARNLQMRIT